MQFVMTSEPSVDELPAVTDVESQDGVSSGDVTKD